MTVRSARPIAVHGVPEPTPLSLINKARDVVFADGIDLQTKFDNMTLVLPGSISGVNAVSPHIIVIKNTDTQFQLKITTVDGTIITPNLKGSAVDFTRLEDRVIELEEKLDADTRYSISLANNMLVLTGSDGSESSIDLSEYTPEENQAIFSMERIEDDIVLYDAQGNESSRISIRQDNPEYASKDEFPCVGQTGKFYVDTTLGAIYRWDPEENTYVELCGSQVGKCITDIERDEDKLVVTKGNSSSSTIQLDTKILRSNIDAMFSF